MKIAIVVGHSEQSQGAINYLGESEYTFNKRIAAKLELKLRDEGIDSDRLGAHSIDYSRRVRAISDMLREDDYIMSLHLHFNSFEGTAKGAEILALDGCNPTTLPSNIFHYLGCHGVPSRGVKFLTPGDRGYSMLADANKAGVEYPLIIEPEFGNKRTETSKLIFEKEDTYVDILARAIQRFFKEV